MDRNVSFSLNRTLFGFPIQYRAALLDEGLQVLITGGAKTHIGSVSTCLPGMEPETKFFPGHKDQYISAPWAKKLSDHLGEPVCVVCGIHYDNATKDEIGQIMKITDEMLEELLKKV